MEYARGCELIRRSATNASSSDCPIESTRFPRNRAPTVREGPADGALTTRSNLQTPSSRSGLGSVPLLPALRTPRCTQRAQVIPATVTRAARTGEPANRRAPTNVENQTRHSRHDQRRDQTARLNLKGSVSITYRQLAPDGFARKPARKPKLRILVAQRSIRIGIPPERR